MWPHEGRAAELVCKLKYRRATVVVSELAQAMADVSPEVDFVTWVPASPSRRRQRGFDQGELLARALARRRGVRVRRLLRRSDDDPQTDVIAMVELPGQSSNLVGHRCDPSPRFLL